MSETYIEITGNIEVHQPVKGVDAWVERINKEWDEQRKLITVA